MTPGKDLSAAIDSVTDSIADAAEVLGDKLAEIKPKLRGWLHLGTAPLALAGGIVLIALSPTTLTRVGSIVFTLSAILLFWGPVSDLVGWARGRGKTPDGASPSAAR